MLAKLKENENPLPAEEKFSHLLVLFPKSEEIPQDLPGREVLLSTLARKNMKAKELAESPLAMNLADGALASFGMLDFSKPVFEQQTQVRSALSPLLAENPKKLHLAVYGSGEDKASAASLAVYSAWVNGQPLPSKKKKPKKKALAKISLFGHRLADGGKALAARARGNNLCRELTALPPNELTPATYRKKIAELAKERGWEFEEYDFDRLRKMGAGAFCAVAQGSSDHDAAIVRLGFGKGKKIALVGKGICFDTGGHNLKPAKYMQGMHEDMNGSAVALGLLLAASESGFDAEIDCYLAIAQNHISPEAYKQNDIVVALDGTTIEIVHTDAEGRMILADSLCLAARKKPDLIVDFSTLTGSMATALGARYSGILGNREELLDLAVAAGKASGERLCVFPSDLDYEEGLESDYADIKQCSMEGDADHILAARFLGRFVGDTPWLHMDLSASNCKGGLGAVSSDITGFGVAWGLEFLQEWLAR